MQIPGEESIFLIVPDDIAHFLSMINSYISLDISFTVSHTASLAPISEIPIGRNY